MVQRVPESNASEEQAKSSADVSKSGYDSEYFAEYVGKGPANGIVIESIANKHMPSPRVANDMLQRLWQEGGMYNYIRPNIRAEMFERRELHPMDGGSELERSAKNAYADWLASRHGLKIDRDAANLENDPLVLTPSMREAMRQFITAHDETGGKETVMGVVTPVYPPFLDDAQIPCKKDSRRTVQLEDTDEGWKLNIEKLKATIREMKEAEGTSRILLLCHPNNPTGYRFSEAELEEILQACWDDDPQRRVRVMADEIGADEMHAEDKKHVPLLSVAQKLEKQTGKSHTQDVMTLHSVGKTFNTYGFPCSLAVVPDKQTREKMSKSLPVSSISQEAAQVTAACMRAQDSGEYVDTLNQVIEHNADLACTTFQELGYPVHKPDGVFLIFIRLSESTNDDQKKSDTLQVMELFKKAGIELRDGNDFGMPGYARMNIGYPTKMLGEQLQKFKAIVMEQRLKESRESTRSEAANILGL
jgi:cystathionine beta-lyase